MKSTAIFVSLMIFISYFMGSCFYINKKISHIFCFSAAECQCKCGFFTGQYCGWRSGGGYLSGGCNEAILYKCNSANEVASPITGCAGSVGCTDSSGSPKPGSSNGTPGLDRCNMRNDQSLFRRHKN